MVRSLTVKVRGRIPLRRIRFAAWLCRLGLPSLGLAVVNGAPIKVQIGNGPWRTVGRVEARHG